MRILAISDLHTDVKKNWQLIQQIPDNIHHDDILIVAGDIASRIDIIAQTLALLQEKFRQVFFVPGNHELWLSRGQSDSLDKFSLIMGLCDKLGVHIRPVQIGNVWIVPLLSWYSAAFDDDGHAYRHQLQHWVDFYACKWPDFLKAPDAYFSDLNTPYIQKYEGTVISFSHFLPRPELLPPRRYLFFKALPQVAGSFLIEQQIRQLQSTIHIFGHSHIKWDVELEGIRYINNPLSLPRRQVVETLPEKIIWET